MKTHIIIIAFISTLFLLSCGNTLNDSPLNSSNLLRSINMNNINSNTRAYLYSINTTYSKMYKNDYYATQHYSQYSYFYNENGDPVRANNIILNGNVINPITDTLHIQCGNNILHEWTIVGNNEIISYKDSIYSIDPIEIISPKALDRIYRDNPLNISYTMIGGIDSVAIIARTDKFKSKHFLGNDNFKYSINSYVVRNSGNINLPNNFFSSFDSNTIVTLEVILYRDRVKTINNSNYRVATASIAKTDIILK